MQRNGPEEKDSPDDFRQLTDYRAQGLFELYFAIDDDMQMKVCELIVEELERLEHDCKTVEVQGLKFIFISTKAAQAVNTSVAQGSVGGGRGELEIPFGKPSGLPRSGYTRINFSMRDVAQLEELRQAIAELDFHDVYHFSHKTDWYVALFVPEDAVALLGLSESRSSIVHTLNGKTDDKKH